MPTAFRQFATLFMGMGEPLNNYQAVLQAIKTMTGPSFSMSPSHITVSTVGVVPESYHWLSMVTSVMYVKDERLVATAGANDGYIPVLEAKLNTLKSGATLVKPDDREKIEMAYTLKTNLWRKRKRMFKDLWDMITEAMPNNLGEFREELGIETDEDAGVKIDDYCNLVVRKPVAKRLNGNESSQ
ncbi:hypothetical protein R1flu_010812 [Riccia fluitans]|uniref:Leucine zipper with capping helix domain-containing protein n=1 Tax=Riccia fluitans TaxID=41844 RepID=A0ABD1Z670_9MARC